jgi:transcription factor IIIB 90 kDa subunit
MSAPSARAPPRCPHCDGVEIDYDPARGDAVCVDCGTVLEENVIVAEVQFAEDRNGRSGAVGQHVSATGRPSSFSVLPGFSREATAITMGNGRRRIWHLVSALRLTTRHAEAALRLFRLAVERNFHKGRRMANVCCACLYVVVRIERTPHLLLDFAEVLETNVYVLGTLLPQTSLRLSHTLDSVLSN